MSPSPPSLASLDRRRLSTPELVALSASAMSLVALSIDSMLPALGTIANDLGAREPNDRQLVLTLFFGGLTAGQMLYGPLADALGRKRAMVFGLTILALGSLVCFFATSFSMVLAGRVVQGIGAAGPRIVSVAVIRDLYAGRAMARIMSFVTAVFILVPIVAPSMGQGVLLLGSWRAIFAVLGTASIVVLAWFTLRQEETLPVARRTSLSIRPVLRVLLEVVKTRETLRYTVAAGLVFAALIAYLATAQQIFGDIYRLGASFPLYFAALAASLGVASIVNGRLVLRFGMHVLSRTALRTSVAVSAVFLVVAVATAGHPPLWAFMTYMLVVFFCNGLLFGNFNALAMEPVGHVAGAAASVVGSLTSLVSTVIGTPIGRAYDGTVVPLVAGLFVMTLAALVVTSIGAPLAGRSAGSSGSSAVPRPE